MNYDGEPTASPTEMISCLDEADGDTGSGADVVVAESADGLDNIDSEEISSETDGEWMPFKGVAPLYWRFPGFATFVCFGPHNGKWFSNLLNPKGNLDGEEEVLVTDLGCIKTTTASRAYSRAIEAKEARMEREHGAERGLGMDTKAQMCSIAQNEEAASMRDRETKLAALTSLVHSKQQMCERRMKMAELTKGDARRQALFEQIDSLDQEIAIHNEEIKSLSNVQRRSNPIVGEIMKQVATAIGVNVSSNEAEDTTIETNVAF
jgi:hypothetical protein